MLRVSRRAWNIRSSLLICWVIFDCSGWNSFNHVLGRVKIHSIPALLWRWGWGDATSHTTSTTGAQRHTPEHRSPVWGCHDFCFCLHEVFALQYLLTLVSLYVDRYNLDIDLCFMLYLDPLKLHLVLVTKWQHSLIKTIFRNFKCRVVSIYFLYDWMWCLHSFLPTTQIFRAVDQREKCVASMNFRCDVYVWSIQCHIDAFTHFSRWWTFWTFVTHSQDRIKLQVIPI
jgi:hypothetical protein